MTEFRRISVYKPAIKFASDNGAISDPDRVYLSLSKQINLRNRVYNKITPKKICIADKRYRMFSLRLGFDHRR